MCEFCDVLTSDRYTKKIQWNTRSTFADENIEEVLEEKSKYSERWIENYSGFEMDSYIHEGNIFVGIQYRKEISNNKQEIAIISPFSETIQFNFCPICGKQISENVKEFKDYYYNQISIEESIK